MGGFRTAAAGDDQVHMATEDHIGWPIFRKCGDTLHFARGAPGRLDTPAAVGLLLVKRYAFQPFAFVALPAFVAQHVRRIGIFQRLTLVVIGAGGLTLGVDRIPHAEHIRQTAALVIRTLTVAALPLRIARAVFCVEQVRDGAVHVPVDELEPRAGVRGVDFQIGLRDRAGADLARDGLHEVVLQQRLVDGAQELVVLHPVRLDGLDLIARSQQHVVEIRCRDDGESEPLGAFRNRGEQVHAIQDTRARSRAQAPEDRPRGIQPHSAVGRRSHRREAHLTVAGHRNRAVGVRGDGRHSLVQRRVLLGDADGLARDHLDLLLREFHVHAVHGRAFGIRTEKGVFLLVQQVVDTLAPVVRLVHPHVAVAARQYRRRGQRYVIRIGVVVRVPVVQREDRNLSCGGLLAQTAMALREDASNMSARNVRRIEPVARPVVEVRDVRRIGDRIVELDARPRRLFDRQLREVRLHGRKLLLVHVLRQAAAAHKPARRRIAALLVHTAHRCEAPKQRPVVLEIDARHAQVLHCRAAGQQLLPVDQSTAVDHQTRDRCRALKRQPRIREAVQADQFQRLQRRRKRRCRKRSTRSEGDAPQRGVTRHERL